MNASIYNVLLPGGLFVTFVCRLFCCIVCFDVLLFKISPTCIVLVLCISKQYFFYQFPKEEPILCWLNKPKSTHSKIRISSPCQKMSAFSTVLSIYVVISIALFFLVFNTSQLVIDEEFHLRQGHQYCIGNFSYVSKWNIETHTLLQVYNKFRL